jgi:hypothetical protein
MKDGKGRNTETQELEETETSFKQFFFFETVVSCILHSLALFVIASVRKELIFVDGLSRTFFGSRNCVTACSVTVRSE